MNSQGTLGILLIVVGTLLLVYQGFMYAHRQSPVAIGVREGLGRKEQAVPVSMVVSAVCLAGGAGLMVFGGRKRL